MNEATKEFTISNALGLHARAAAKLVKITSHFKSEISITREGYKVNGKSILGLLTLAAACGTKIQVHCLGDDAEEALNAIGECIDQKFGEN